MADLARPTVLLTGGTGYLGSQIARRLVEGGWEVHVVVRPRSKLDLIEPLAEQVRTHVHDGSTEGLLEIAATARPSVVFHLAALFIGQHKPSHLVPLLQSNVVFGTQVLEAMAQSGVRCLVNTGTWTQHYQNAAYNPASLYAATKRALEDLIEYYVQAAGLSVITLELFDTYGPGDPRPKLFNLLARTMQQAEPLAMTGGEQSVSPVYIDDVVEAYLVAAQRLLAGEALGHERYSVADRPWRLREVVELFRRVAGGERPLIQWGAIPYHPREMFVPWTGGLRLPGWTPKIGLEEGIRRFLQQYQAEAAHAGPTDPPGPKDR